MTMHCVSCKRSTQFRGARYCAWCGAPLQALLWSGDRPVEVDTGDEEAALRVDCRRCGKANTSAYAHCVHCGSRMDAGPGTAPASPEAVERAADLVDAARSDLAARRGQQARARCEDALALDPRCAEAHALLAEALFSEGSVAGALQEMTAALRYDPGNSSYERRLRELRDEQDKALQPLLRDLGEPRRTRRPPVRREPRRPAAARKPAWQPASSLPEWAKVAILIGGALLLVWLAPALTRGVGRALDLVLGALITIFVFYDARAQGFTPPAVILWAGLVFAATFFGGCSAGLVALLAYLLITRTRR